VKQVISPAGGRRDGASAPPPAPASRSGFDTNVHATSIDPPADPGSSVDALLRSAIETLRVISFVLDGRPRVAEPHDYGIIDGDVRLLFYQVGGESRSGAPLGWRLSSIAKISQLKVLDRTFPGPRTISSGRHRRWDALIASVSRPPGPVTPAAPITPPERPPQR
jgi:hypothetical protein